MGKYKKRLRAEKAKVKLKNKKLPKGQNITDTSFKVKKIVTVEQLKKVGENEPVSSWNVPLKDLLIHLHHHNKSSRLNALNGIKEIVLKYPDALKGPLLKSTVMGVLEIMTDIESKVRAAAVSLLDIIFLQLDFNEILGFHEILNLHLTCAMTHRMAVIQKDSLKLADVIVKYAPDAVKNNIKTIIVNFIRILSGYRYGARSEIFLVKGSKKDLEENRIAIFQRLRNILKICYIEKEDVKDAIACDKKQFSKKIFTRHYKKVPDLSDVLRTQGSISKRTNAQNYENDFKLVVSQIMPLIFETWSEFCPASHNNCFVVECVLKESTARLLSSVLEIIRILYETSLRIGSEDVRNLFNVNYGSQFVRSFLLSFPFVPHVMEELPNALSESVVAYTRSYESQNLTICYLAYRMRLKMNQGLMKILDSYIMQASLIRNTKCEEILSNILEFMVFSPWKHKRTDVYMQVALKSYKQATNAGFQKRLLQILSKVITDDVKYVHVVENEYLQEWISYLAKGLYKSKIHAEVLEILSKAIRRKMGRSVLSEIENKFTDIIKNIPDIDVEGCDEFDGRKCIANILYWCDNKVIETALENGILEENRYPDDIKSYLFNIFNYKLKGHILSEKSNADI